MKKSISVLLIVLFAIWAILITCIPVFWFIELHTSTTFEVFQQSVLELFEGAYLLNEINVHFLSESHYQSIQAHLSIWLMVFLLIIVALVLTCFYLVKAVFEHRYLVVSKFSLTNKQWVSLGLLGVVWLGYKVFLFDYFPLHIDEVFDFIHFTKNNLITRHSYQFTDGVLWYNNHVLYTDFSNIFLTLGFSDKLAIRLPSMISEGVLLVLLIKMSEKHQLAKRIFVVCIVLLSFWSSIYSIQGRSYMMVSLFCVLAYKAFDNYIENRSPVNLLVLVASFTLGVASSKLFVIPCFGLVLYGLFKYKRFNSKEYKLLFVALLNSILLSLILYYPVLMISGLGNVIPIGGSGDYQYLIDHLPALLEGISVITNVNYKAYLVLIFTFISLMFFHKRYSKETKNLYLFFGTQLVALFLYIVLAKQYLPFRAMIYLNVIFSLLLAYSFYDLIIDNVKSKKIGFTVCILLLGLNTSFNFKYSWLKKCGGYIYDFGFYEKLSNDLNEIDQHSPKRILIYDQMHFSLFYSILRNEEITESFESVPLLVKGDVIIAKNPIAATEMLKTSSIDEGLILKK